MKYRDRQDILDILDNYDVLNIYIVGSLVYNTYNENSDVDVKVVVKDSPFKTHQFTKYIYDITLYRLDYFMELVEDCEIDVLEALMSDNKFKHETINIAYNIKPKLLRHSISSISSNSWVKCKKKLLQNDYNIGIKSMFHSMRLLDFGIQIMEKGFIKDFTSSNHIWDKLKSKSWNWDELVIEFKSYRNSLKTRFKKLAPK